MADLKMYNSGIPKYHSPCQVCVRCVSWVELVLSVRVWGGAPPPPHTLDSAVTGGRVQLYGFVRGLVQMYGFVGGQVGIYGSEGVVLAGERRILLHWDRPCQTLR